MKTDWLAFGWLIAGVVAMIVAYAWWTSRTRTTRHKKIICPITGKPVEVVAVRDRRTGHWIDVRHCSAPAAGTTQCQNACLDVLNDGAFDLDDASTRPSNQDIEP